MIVSQPDEGNLMMIRPIFSVADDPLKITFNVVNIVSTGHKTAAGGFGTYPIQTEFHHNSSSKTFTEVNSIIIDTPLSNAWFNFINSALGTNSHCTVEGDTLTITFTQPPTIEYKIITIQAQIGPGWVDQ
jgi:hypothetical protein